MSKEAMKLALEALENAQANFGEWWPEAIAALRKALAEQPAQQQEPVAYMVRAHGMLQRLSRRADVADEIACQYRKDDPSAEVFPLYTSPPAQRKPLTDEQREEIAKGWRGRNWTVGDIIDATEAAHGIKE